MRHWKEQPSPRIDDRAAVEHELQGGHVNAVRVGPLLHLRELLRVPEEHEVACRAGHRHHVGQ